MDEENPPKKQKGEVCPAEAFLHGALLKPTCGSEQPFPTTDETSAWTFSTWLELKLLLPLFLFGVLGKSLREARLGGTSGMDGVGQGMRVPFFV